MTRASALVALACGLLAGCGGGSQYVPVSGVVKVDGQPYKNAVVSFQPVGGAGNENPGVGSTAVTDDQGRFALVAADGKTGAAVGKNRVRIQTKREGSTAFVDPTTGSADSDPNAAKKPKGQVDPIPVEWYGDTGNKEFVVPVAGTDQANFDITSQAKPSKK